MIHYGQIVYNRGWVLASTIQLFGTHLQRQILPTVHFVQVFFAFLSSQLFLDDLLHRLGLRAYLNLLDVFSENLTLLQHFKVNLVELFLFELERKSLVLLLLMWKRDFALLNKHFTNALACMIDEMHLRCLFLNDENTFLQIIEQLLLAPLWQHGLHELEANPGDNKLENDAEADIYYACLKAQNEKLHDGSFVGVDVMIDDDLGVGEAHYNGGDVSLAIVPVDDQA